MKIMNGKFQSFLRSPEYRHVGILRMMSYACLVILIIIVSLTLYFVYHNVIGAVSQMEIIRTMQTHSVGETIDFNGLEKVKAAWNKKHATSTIVIPARDPFSDPIVATNTPPLRPSL